MKIHVYEREREKKKSKARQPAKQEPVYRRALRLDQTGSAKGERERVEYKQGRYIYRLKAAVVL